MLREAGVTGIQPGIESFSTDDLERMAKGTTALQNVRTIKWCREEGIVPMWNVIYGFPGETSADYEATRRITSAIRFLDPPWAHGTVRLDRFSRYHASPEAYGFTRVRPVAAYGHVYRLPAESLGRLAYHFDFDYLPGFEPGRAAEGIAALCRDWRSAPEKGTLFHYARPDGALAITDTRSDALRRHEILTGPEQEVYTFCDADRPTSSILRRVHERFPGARDDAQIRAFLERLVAERWMASDRDRWLSLSVRAPLTRAGLSVLLG